MSNQDYEDDEQQKLRITDPSGNTSEIEPGVKPCPVCNAGCVYSDRTCQGEVDMMSDVHLCDEHKKKFGGSNRWYESVETDTESPFPREVGTT